MKIFFKEIFMLSYITGTVISPGTSLLTPGDVAHRLQESGADCIICDTEIAARMNDVSKNVPLKIVVAHEGADIMYVICRLLNCYQELILHFCTAYSMIKIIIVLFPFMTHSSPSDLAGFRMMI